MPEWLSAQARIFGPVHQQEEQAQRRHREEEDERGELLDAAREAVEERVGAARDAGAGALLRRVGLVGAQPEVLEPARDRVLRRVELGADVAVEAGDPGDDHDDDADADGDDQEQHQSGAEDPRHPVARHPADERRADGGDDRRGDHRDDDHLRQPEDPDQPDDRDGDPDEEPGDHPGVAQPLRDVDDLGQLTGVELDVLVDRPRRGLGAAAAKSGAGGAWVKPRPQGGRGGAR